MSRDFEVIGYTKNFSYINLDLKKNNSKHYELALLVCYIEEFKKGMKVSRIYKTTKKGTSIKYENIKTKEEGLKYSKEIEKMVEEYHVRYSN